MHPPKDVQVMFYIVSESAHDDSKGLHNITGTFMRHTVTAGFRAPCLFVRCL